MDPNSELRNRVELASVAYLRPKAHLLQKAEPTIRQLWITHAAIALHWLRRPLKISNDWPYRLYPDVADSMPWFRAVWDDTGLGHTAMSVGADNELSRMDSDSLWQHAGDCPGRMTETWLDMRYNYSPGHVLVCAVNTTRGVRLLVSPSSIVPNWYIAGNDGYDSKMKSYIEHRSLEPELWETGLRIYNVGDLPVRVKVSGIFDKAAQIELNEEAYFIDYPNNEGYFDRSGQQVLLPALPENSLQRYPDTFLSFVTTSKFRLRDATSMQRGNAQSPPRTRFKLEFDAFEPVESSDPEKPVAIDLNASSAATQVLFIKLQDAFELYYSSHFDELYDSQYYREVFRQTPAPNWSYPR